MGKLRGAQGTGIHRDTQAHIGLYIHKHIHIYIYRYIDARGYIGKQWRI